MTFPPNTTALDADVDMTKAHAELIQLGFDTVIRYTTKGSGNPEKQVSAAEAKSMQAHGLKLLLVHETTAERALQGAAAGKADGEYCAGFAPTVGLPPNNGSVLLASTDFDVTGSQAPAVQAYVEAFKAASPGYGTGLYGNGYMNDRLYDAKIITVRWITQSMGFTGTRESLDGGRFEIVQRLPQRIAGMDTDPDSLREPGLDVGARVPFAPPVVIASVPASESILQQATDFIKKEI